MQEKKTKWRKCKNK